MIEIVQQLHHVSLSSRLAVLYLFQQLNFIPGRFGVMLRTLLNFQCHPSSILSIFCQPNRREVSPSKLRNHFVLSSFEQISDTHAMISTTPIFTFALRSAGALDRRRPTRHSTARGSSERDDRKPRALEESFRVLKLPKRTCLASLSIHAAVVAPTPRGEPCPTPSSRAAALHRHSCTLRREGRGAS